jgi:hypothetical protein
MRVAAMLAALGLLASGASETAFGKSAEWLRHDREVIRQMNLRELAKVRQRDARYAAHNRTVRSQQEAYARRRAAYERDWADYEEQRRDYGFRLAAWRRDMADCRAGMRSAC